MKKMYRIFLFLFGLGILMSTFVSEVSAEVTGSAEGDLAPEIELNTLTGEQIKLSSLKGKTVIVNFWTSWCTYCQSEVSELNSFYESTNHQELEVLGVNITSSEKSIQQVDQFVKQYKMNFPILLDKQGEVAKSYRIIGIPTTFVIDGNGRIKRKLVGPITKEMLQTL
ncbi:TlpA family protein disulfide reductase [Metabacillus herbersteinensis]|uniref:TlpA family protein disulfide reductase n=1 Tax=Metabacillus herbersteinensis TaxID=283816 RepID=A0ABV6GAA5_9BACI